jgi:hypothetical protein
VKVEAGFYYSLAHPTTVTMDPTALPLTIEGIGGVGSTAPIIFSSADPGFRLGTGSVLSNVWLNSAASFGDAVADEGGAIDHSSIRASGTACHLIDSAVVVDTLCWSHGTMHNGAVAAEFRSGGAITLRGVTAAESDGGSGLLVISNSNLAIGTVHATNSILNGGSDGDIDLASGPGDSITATLSHCDFAAVVDHTGGEDVVTATSTVKARPKYADPGVFRFEEAPRSPTINAGAPDPDTDHTDLDGQPRTIGKGPDIGAYEITQRPTVRALSVPRSTVTQTKAHVSVQVGAGGEPTAIRYRLTRARHKAVVIRRSAGQAGTPRTLSKVLRRLAPGTRYTLVVTARNLLGSASSRRVRFTTKRRHRG